MGGPHVNYTQYTLEWICICFMREQLICCDARLHWVQSHDCIGNMRSPVGMLALPLHDAGNQMPKLWRSGFIKCPPDFTARGLRCSWVAGTAPTHPPTSSFPSWKARWEMRSHSSWEELRFQVDLHAFKDLGWLSSHKHADEHSCDVREWDGPGGGTDDHWITLTYVMPWPSEHSFIMGKVHPWALWHPTNR